MRRATEDTLRVLTALLGLVAASLPATKAAASYQMFCEIGGVIVSQPSESDPIEFDFLVDEARELDVEGVGPGEPDCHLLVGERISVTLDPNIIDDDISFDVGQRLLLQRFEMDVIDRQTGGAVRSIRYTVKHIRQLPVPPGTGRS